MKKIKQHNFTINPEVISLFSEEQILSAVDYDSIIFPPTKMA
jgi:hypothetical protein